MLSEKLKNELSERDNVLECLIGWKGKKIRRLTFFDDSSYGCGVNIYLMSKKDFDSPSSALCAAWMKQYLWEEDLEESFDFSSQSAESIYGGAFSEELAKYSYKAIDEHMLKKFINNGVKALASVIKAQQPDENADFLEKAGVYVDKKYTSKNSYIFKADEKFIDAVLLASNDSANKFEPFRIMFFETDGKYGFYCD